MTTIVRILFILSTLFISTWKTEAQCASFAKGVCKPMLKPYLHDGNYNAVTMSEGESAELFKTFYADQKYRIVIGKAEALPQIHFRITDSKGKTIFDNAQHQYALIWDFEVYSTQIMNVQIKVLDDANNSSEYLKAGCVAILFGIADQ